MPASVRETALAALAGVIAAAVPGATIVRNQDIPERLPVAGLVVLNDGALREVVPMLSPLAYLHDHAAECIVMVERANDSDRDTAADALARTVAVAIAADRTLGGTVDWCGAEAATAEVVDGGDRVKALRFEITLSFHSPTSPLH